MSQPANIYTFEVFPDANLTTPSVTAPNIVPFWFKTIHKNDILEVGISREKSFLMSIDRVAVAKRITNRTVEAGIKIQARSMIKTLLDDDIVFAPELSISKKAIELLGNQRATFLGLLRGWSDTDGRSQFVNQNPLAAILWVFLNMPSISSKILYADYDDNGRVLSSFTDKIGNIFDFDFMAYEADLMYDQGLSQYQGKVWNYIMQCIDPMFYEVFEESVVDAGGRLRPKIIVRPKPFTRSTDVGADDSIIKLSVEGGAEPTPDRVPTEEEQMQQGNKGSLVPSGDTVTLGDFIIRKENITRNNITGSSYVVSVKGYDSTTHKFDGSIKRIKLFWDNHAVDSDFKTLVTQQPFHTINENVTGENGEYASDIGHSTYDIVNYVSMHATKEVLSNTDLARYGYLYPLMDCYSIARYGIRRVDCRTVLMHGVEQKEATSEDLEKYTQKFEKAKIFPITEAVKLRTKFWSWYRYNEMFLSGSIQIEGNDDIRKGDKIFVPHHFTPTGAYGVYYYVTGVSGKWRISEGGMTYLMTLEVERGENPKDIVEYNYATGYDLFDKGIEQDGDRRNPILKIDEVMVEPKPENIAGGEPGASKGDLTQAAVDVITKGFNAFPSSYKSFNIENAGVLIKAIASSVVNPNVITAIIEHESAGFNPFAVSSTGCSGLGQICIPTAKTLSPFQGGKLIVQGSGTVKDKSDVRFNPLLSISAVDCLLYNNGFNNGTLKAQVEAICKYGNNNQSSYFGLIISGTNGHPGLKDIEPSNPLCGAEAKQIAKNWYSKR